MENKKIIWAPQYDQMLKSFVRKYGFHDEWECISTKMNRYFNTIAFNKKKCMDRWMLLRKPYNNPVNWSEADEHKLFLLYQEKRNKWIQISKSFPNKNINQIKNRFYSCLRKRVRFMGKWLGIKNSTQLVKSVKPKPLATLLLNISQQEPQMMNVLLKIDQQIHQRTITEEQKKVYIKIIEKIIIERENIRQENQEKDEVAERRKKMTTRSQDKKISEMENQEVKMEPQIKMQPKIKFEQPPVKIQPFFMGIHPFMMGFGPALNGVGPMMMGAEPFVKIEEGLNPFNQIQVKQENQQQNIGNQNQGNS